MASVYGYATLANVEAFTGIDYSTVDSTAFSDANVEYTISIAEYMINAHMGATGAQTITDGVTITTVMIAALLMDNKMQHLGYHGEEGHIKELIGMDIHQILTHFLGDVNVGVDAIPMSGAND